MDKTNCRVIFKMTPLHPEYDDNPDFRDALQPECIAFLLDVDANFGNVMSYMHIGQHGEASVEFFQACKLINRHSATEVRDAIALREELESMGYELDERVRWNRRK